MGEHHFEKMQVAHLDQVLEIERVSFPTPWTRQAFLSELYYNDFASYYVCMLDDRVIGYAGMWVIIDEAHVTNVAVHPCYRGQHVGRAILQYILSQAADKGVERITLEVRPSNQPARRLYQNLGFAPVGVRRGYYSDTDEDAIIMWCTLQA